MPKAGTNAQEGGFEDTLNPQDFARSKMGNISFDVYKKCVHGVKKCRHCHVIPLFDKLDRIVNYFVTHSGRDGRLITNTVGIGGIRPQQVQYVLNQQRDAALALLNLKHSVPEGGTIEEPDDCKPEPPIIEIQIDPELQRLHSEHSVITEPTTTEHLKSSMGSQFEQVKQQMKTSFSTPIIRKSSKCIEQLMLLLYGLQYDTRLEAVVSRCIAFLSGISDEGIVMALNDTLMTYVSEVQIPDQLKGKTLREAFSVEQAAPSTPEMFSSESLKVWETLKQGIFTKHLSYILGTVFAFSTCSIRNVKFSHPIYEKILEHASAEEIDGMDLIDHGIKLYNWTTTVGMACLESRSLEPLTINSGTLAKCHAKYYEWHRKFLDFKRSGSSTMEERQIMYTEVETVLKVLERFAKVQKEKFMTLQASSLMKEVLALYNDVRDFVQKIDRVKVAKGYHITGAPKAGKSTIVPKICEQMCLARGVEYREQDSAQINLMAPYQDELNNATQTIVINETIPIKEHLAKSVENAYNTALALVDPVPYHPNRSSLEEKSKNTMTHIAVVSTGNTAQPFIHVAKTPGAWERRYTIIDQRVKDEYADEFGRLDSSKTDGSDDYHWFDVYEIVYVQKEKKIVYYTLENGKTSVGLDTRELFELIRHQCIQHYAEQDRLEAEHKSKKHAGCLNCKRLANMCVCPDKDAHTVSHLKIGTKECEVDDISLSDACPERTRIGDMRTPCKFHSGGVCAYCGREEPKEEEESEACEPEMGIVGTAVSTVGSLAWQSVLPWVNPFIKMKWLWDIDNNVMKCFHEEIVEELSYWPEVVGCTTFSLLPRSWVQRDDGSMTWLGRRKDNFLRMVAAEKQIFLPLSYLLRRALCLGIIAFIVLTTFGAAMEYFGLNPREYDQVVMRAREYKEWGWYYFYPQYSQFVLQRREMYAEMGIFTERYLDWKQYYVNIYLWEKLLGLLCIPWYFTYTRYVPVLETHMYQWWLMPLIVSASITIFMFFFMWWRRAMGFQQRYEDLKKRTMSDPNLQTTLYDRARRHCTEYNTLVPTAVGVIGAIVTGLMIWNRMRAPEMAVKEERKGTWDDWFTFLRQVPESAESKNSSSDEAAKNVGKVLTYIEATVQGKTRCIHGIYLEPGVLTIPRHFFKADPYQEELEPYVDLSLETNGVKTNLRAYSKNLVRIAGKDAVVVFVPKAPSIGVSLKSMLPRKTGSEYIKCRLLYLKKQKPEEEDKNVALRKNFVLKSESLNAKYKDPIDCAGFSCGRGLEYVSKVTTIGFCGSVLMTDRRDPVFAGFHISGEAYGLTSRKGYAQEIVYEDYVAAVEKLKNQPHYRKVPEMKVLHTTRLGLNLVPNEGPHPKTKMFEEGEMNLYSGIQVIGHTTELPKYRSRVRRSMISDKIEEHCGQPCRWRAPYLKEPWVHHNKNLKRIAKGAFEVPPESLRWARDDYWNQILKPLRDHIAKRPDLCRELTLDEAINGVKDSWYMNRFDMKTSAGIPNGNKLNSGLFVEIEPYEDGRKRYKLSDEGQKYFDDMMATFDRGERIGIYVRTCLKDEVVEDDSEKVRIFYILECLFGLACRMYYLPIAEFISRNPMETECMVGVNCAGPQWEKLVAHINELATDAKLNDWDFSGYDLCRSMDVMCTSLNIYEDVGREMCYSQKALNRMGVIGEELRNPMVNWNGTIMFLFLWCSGNSMTVYGNSTDNSLHQRISFHWNGVRERGDKFYELGTYQENEHTATYGDDGHAGSKPEVRDITKFTSRKRYFDFIGMGFTNARKDGSEDETIESALVDFLKRKSVYHPELRLRVGALDQNSIWKMAHMSHGQGEPEDLAIATIQTMLHEAFLHGDTFYEWLRTRLRLVAGDCLIWCKELDYSYYEKVQLWKEKYES
jgi:hypothetical protein